MSEELGVATSVSRFVDVTLLTAAAQRPHSTRRAPTCAADRHTRCTVRNVSTTRRSNRPVLGWREWVSLPEWGIGYLKAKVDTGARTSSLHAFDLEWFQQGDAPWVRFEIHPWQRSTADALVAEAPVVSTRDIKSSSGSIDHRPVIRTSLVIAGIPTDAEITLTRRDEMGFRMLIGREAIRRRFLVDPGVSYRGGRPSKDIRTKNRSRT